MIKVNQLGSVNFISRPAFKANEPKNVTVEENDVTMNGANALASYNKIMLKNSEILDVEPLPMIYTEGDEIEGEKIYDSEGKLYSIAKEDENTKTLYYPDEEDENKIEMAKVIDKKSGNSITEQENYFDDNNKITETYIKQYNPETKDIIATTQYRDGKPVSAERHFNNGQDVTIRNDIEYNEYNIYADSKFSHSYMIFDKDKQISGAYQEYMNGMKTVSKRANFYNGSLISISKDVTTTIPNSLGVDKLNNPELTPAPRYEVDKDYKGLKGEKTYYSNDALETNIVGDVKAHFNPEGELRDLYIPDKTISFYNNGCQTIEETLENGKTKTTKRCKDDGVSVTLDSEEGYSTVHLDENNRPVAYYEGVKDENGETKDTLSLYFNQNGMLESAYKY